MERDADRVGSRELAHRLLEAIDAGEYGVDEKLPSYRDLAREHGIAVGTAREALRLLEQYGRVAIRHGSGAFVVSTEASGSTGEQIRALQAELEEVRAQVRQAENTLAATEERLAVVVDRISRIQ
jgi:DNA-binding GntR family transcriptional regulator